MRNNGSSVTIVLVAVSAIGLIGCNRSQGTVSAQGGTGAIAQPAASAAAPSPANVTSPSSPSSAALPSPAPAVSEPGAPVKLVAADNTQSFTIADHTFRMLVHSQRIEREPGKTGEEAVEWWELRNSRDQVVYREQYPVSVVNGVFEFSMAVTAKAFKTAQGAGIIVERSEEPSDPLSGGSVQVFGYKYGRDRYGVDESLFQSFGPPIWVEGDYLGIGQDEIHPTPTLPRGVTMTIMNDILRFKVWTGNFFVMYPVRINWITGQLEPAHRCIETTSKGRVERCRYPVEVDAHREGEATFVRLFPEADEGFTPKHIVLQPDSKIEFLEASMQIDWAGDAKAVNFSVNGDIWLKVRIGGQEGWIHSEEDFQAVGIPQAG